MQREEENNIANVPVPVVPPIEQMFTVCHICLRSLFLSLFKEIEHSHHQVPFCCPFSLPPSAKGNLVFVTPTHLCSSHKYQYPS